MKVQQETKANSRESREKTYKEITRTERVRLKTKKEKVFEWVRQQRNFK